jgi:neutral ceramidase
MNAMKAGFAAVCITPIPGKDIPGLFERRVAVGTHDDLYARAAVIEMNRVVALVQVDAIVVPERVVDDARKQAQQLCGIPAAHCFIAATHTHSGGPLFGGFLSEPDEEYMAFVAGQIAAAISEAYRNRRPARAGWSQATAPGVAYNRRFHMKGGFQRTHPGKMHPDIVDAAGPEDPAVTVLSFSDPRTFMPFGCIVNFACHATHMNGWLYSADYVKWVVDTLRAVYGCGFGVVFLNGACGDVTQVDNRSPRPLELGPYWAERTGRSVGGAAVQAVAKTDYQLNASLDYASVKVRAAIRPISADTLRRAKRLLREQAVTAEDVETIYANESIKIDAWRKQQAYRNLEITGIRIGNGLFWGVPAEFFQAFALEVATSSPFEFTCCVELANGYNGYVCAESAFAGGGYEVRTARSSFLEEKAGAKVVRAAQSLCQRMHMNARRERASLKKVWPEYQDDSALNGINQLSKKTRKK